MTTIDTGNFDESRYPIPPAPIEPSADECRHTPVPKGYGAWYEWCEQASKTHWQIRCPCCGLWAIWLPKAEAKEINRRKEREAKQFAKQYQRHLDEEKFRELKKKLRK